MKTKLSEVRYGSKKDTTRLTAAKKMTSVRKGRKENKLVQLVQAHKATVAPAWASLDVRIILSSEGKVEHLTKSDGGTEAVALHRLWHDWFLLSEAHTCTFVRSSFPRTACYASLRRQRTDGLIHQFVTTLDLARYARTTPDCTTWRL